MTVDIEFIGIIITVLSPIYASLWYLIILGTTNKNDILELKNDIFDLRTKMELCTYCKKGVHDHK